MFVCFDSESELMYSQIPKTKALMQQMRQILAPDASILGHFDNSERTALLQEGVSIESLAETPSAPLVRAYLRPQALHNPETLVAALRNGAQEREVFIVSHMPVHFMIFSADLLRFIAMQSMNLM